MNHESGPLASTTTVDGPAPTAPAEEVPELIIEPQKGWIPIHFGDLWRYRELLYFLTWRDVKIRYKQTVLGFLWAFLQPFLKMVVFSVIFGGLAKMDSEGFPYPIFVFAGLLPWQFFSESLSRSSQSVVGSSNLITKVYFPRLVIPLAAVVVLDATTVWAARMASFVAITRQLECADR